MSQTTYYESLLDRAAETLDAETLTWAYEAEPESAVFTAADLVEACEDPDEARHLVNEVGARDLDAKIRHWETVLADGEEE